MRDDALPKLRAALRALGEWFRATKTQYVVIGGAAVALVARARATEDIDALVLVEDNQIVPFIQSGAPFGFAPRIKRAAAVGKVASVLPLVHEPSRTPLDVVFAGLAYEKQAIRHGSRFLDEDLDLRIPRPEDLIIMKAVASRPLDLGDIDMILDMRPEVDRTYIRRWTRRFAATLEDPEIIANVERLLSAKRLPLASKKKRRRK